MTETFTNMSENTDARPRGEILSVSPMTGTVYAVSDWEDLGEGKIISKSKRELTRDEIDVERLHGPARRAYNLFGVTMSNRPTDGEQQSENIYASVPETTEYGVRVAETGPNGWRRVMRFWTPEPSSREEALEIAAEDHDEVLSSLDDVNTRSVPQPEGWSDE